MVTISFVLGDNIEGRPLLKCPLAMGILLQAVEMTMKTATEAMLRKSG
jgi:hypothetical protein